MNKTLSLIIVIFLVALTAVPVTAQNNQNQLRNRVQNELENTDRIIERAREQAQLADNPVATAALVQADKLQEEARNRYNDEMYEQAYKLTLLARQRALTAIANSRQTEQNEGVLLQKLERAGDLLERCKELLELEDNDNLQAVYELAGDNLTRAWEFYRNGDYKPALKLANQVIRAAEKIISSYNEQIHKFAFYERQRENVSQVMENARRTLGECEIETARQYMEQAENAFERAGELSDEKQYRGALQQLRQAREMALQAAQACQGVETLNDLYRHLQTEAERLAERIAARDGNFNGEVHQLMTQLEQQLALSLQFIQNDDLKPAKAALKAAQLIMNQLQNRMKGF